MLRGTRWAGVGGRETAPSCLVLQGRSAPKCQSSLNLLRKSANYCWPIIVRSLIKEHVGVESDVRVRSPLRLWSLTSHHNHYNNHPTPAIIQLSVFFSVFYAGVLLRDQLLGVSHQDAGGDGVGLRPGQVQRLHRWAGDAEREEHSPPRPLAFVLY